MRRAPCAVASAALLVAGAAVPAAGQRYWDRSLTPLVYYTTTDGVWAAAYAKLFSPVIGHGPRPEPHFAWATLSAAASSEGSYRVGLDLQAPAWWEGWRFGLTLSARRGNRHGYYGTGNATPFSADSVTTVNPYFYRVSRTARTARATVQRRLAGPLRLFAGATLQHTDFRPLPGATVFERDVAAGIVDGSAIPFHDAAARVGLVLDTRDHEVAPHRGVLVEALVGGGRGYARATLAAQGYIRPVERLALAARVAAERLSAAAPLAAQAEMESSAEPFVVLGGYRSLRGFHDGRFVGPGRLLAGVELRYALLWAPPYELHLVAFYDAGRVFAPGEEPRFTTDGLHAGWGGELAARAGRNTLLVVGAGFAPDDWQLMIETRWSY